MQPFSVEVQQHLPGRESWQVLSECRDLCFSAEKKKQHWFEIITMASSFLSLLLLLLICFGFSLMKLD